MFHFHSTSKLYYNETNDGKNDWKNKKDCLLRIFCFSCVFESAKISENRITGQTEEELKKVIYS